MYIHDIIMLILIDCKAYTIVQWPRGVYMYRNNATEKENNYGLHNIMSIIVNDNVSFTYYGRSCIHLDV